MAKSMTGRLKAGVSRVATAIAQGMGPVLRTKHNTFARVSKKRGRRGTPHAAIIRYDREGPFFRQTGHSDQKLQKYYVHRLLHATKGWRVYTGGPTLPMPQASMSVPARLAFYGSHYGVPARA